MPILRRFQGHPKTPSIKSRFMTLLGYAPPFDRHDWVVERCGKQTVYIIDFYSGQQQSGLASFYLDVRPRFANGGWWLRLRRNFYEVFGK